MSDQTSLSKGTIGFGVAFFVASLFNGLLVILKESNPALKDFMKSLFGHHWTTHGIFVLAVFLLLGLVFSRMATQEKFSGNRIFNLVLYGTIIGGLLISGFFLSHVI